MGKSQNKFIVTLIVLGLLLSSISPALSAGTNSTYTSGFKDTFPWSGNASINNGILEIGGPHHFDDDDDYNHYRTILEHESTVEYGTWSFDRRQNNILDRRDTIYFVSNSSFELLFSTSDEPVNFPEFTFRIEKFTLEVTVWRGPYTLESAVSSPHSDDVLEWHHYDITRDEQNTLTLYVDGKERMSHTIDQLLIDNPMKLTILTSSGARYDNIAVSDTVDVSDRSDITFPILIFVPVLVMIILINRKRLKLKG
ncbi:MAG: LamG-like jellyroll fold domain-containing protein [Candidatus Kariarchaeaceae archaeon]|jgi:hypothetical protein